MTIRELANAILDMPYGGVIVLAFLAASMILPAAVSILIATHRK